jgi:hypothetical protein
MVVWIVTDKSHFWKTTFVPFKRFDIFQKKKKTKLENQSSLWYQKLAKWYKIKLQMHFKMFVVNMVFWSVSKQWQADETFVEFWHFSEKEEKEFIWWWCFNIVINIDW